MFLPVGNHDGGGGAAVELPAERGDLPLGSTGVLQDRLSALSDDILLSILLRLPSTAAAARTSVLSRRWRGLWSQLPEIRFPFPSDPAAVGPALAASATGPALRLLHVACRDDAGAEAWLRTAAGRLGAGSEIYFYNRTPGEERAHVGALSWQCHTFQLPCFETAGRVWLRLGFVDLNLPLTGVFERLTELRLEHVNLDCGSELGDMVSSPRCPALRELCISIARGVDSLCIISETLERLELDMMNGLEDLTVNAPMLRALNVHACFTWRKPVAAIYASRLELLWWSDAFDPSFVVFSQMANLQQLTTFNIPVYGRFDFALLQDSLMLLQHFPVVSQLDLKLNYERDLSRYVYLMGTVTKLPNIKILSLWLHTKGHAIGASVFHLLSICPGVRKLKLTLRDNLKVDTPCTSVCACQQENWNTSYTLDILEEVEIRNFRGSEHDFAFVEMLFSMSPAMKKMTITLHHLASPSELLLSLGNLETCFEIKYDTSEVSYEPSFSLFPETPDDHCT
uniref:Uncharacterized protein n=1 Tax=Avena sativa TaxID=4498 RepID=A0ACD5UYB0_AVESA